jgi:hypothetical protein
MIESQARSQGVQRFKCSIPFSGARRVPVSNRATVTPLSPPPRHLHQVQTHPSPSARQFRLLLNGLAHIWAETDDLAKRGSARPSLLVANYPDDCRFPRSCKVSFSGGTNVPVGGLPAALQLRSQSYRSRLRKAPRLTCARSGNARFPPCMSRSALDYCVEFTEWES